MLLDGTGVAKEPSLALRWFLRAAEQGDAEAMNMVGRCHENGWGACVDLCAAAHWYRQSAARGHDWGEYNLANLLFDGRGIAADRSAALVWYLRAASQGHARAMNLLARCCEEGWGCSKDPRQALHWYRRSAEGGYFRGQFNYASLPGGTRFHIGGGGLVPKGGRCRESRAAICGFVFRCARSRALRSKCRSLEKSPSLIYLEGVSMNVIPRTRARFPSESGIVPEYIARHGKEHRRG